MGKRPSLDVIIPVGPGHEELHQDAIASVTRAILTDKGVFSSVRCKVIDDTDGGMGRGAARNYGVQESEAEWIFFLDADDLMHPEALAGFPYNVTDYDAIWGQIMEMREGCILDRYQRPRIESYAELIADDPFYSIQMGHFVRRDAALATPFNEDMKTGEDWDYYLRLWKSHRCAKLRLKLYINRRGQHSTGPNKATGREWMEVVHALLERARNE